jgi:hypothetical protein
MIDIGPLIYEPTKSFEVQKLSEAFLESNDELSTGLSQCGWCYNSISKVIPQTNENFWSGHFFPYIESTEELQVSLNLALFGFYKQAYSSLRCALEVGMLSVYYNINDDGHTVVKDWLRSKDTWEANTPRADKIWKILKTNSNIKKFSDKFGLKKEFDSLSFLHNFVHTKGYKHSNTLGKLKGNYQTFESDIFVKWCKTYQKVVTLLIKLHILKYPISVIEYDWSKKIGIDNPFPVVNIFEVDRIKSILPNDQFREIQHIANHDSFTQELFLHIKSIPDMTLDERENQIIYHDKFMIESGLGFIEWEKKELDLLQHFDDDSNKNVLKRIEFLRSWAVENNMMKPKMERLSESP